MHVAKCFITCNIFNPTHVSAEFLAYLAEYVIIPSVSSSRKRIALCGSKALPVKTETPPGPTPAI